MLFRQYRDFCESQGWGRPPVTSRAIRDRSHQRGPGHPEIVKAYMQKAEQKRRERRKSDPAYARDFYERLRQARQKKLTESDKAERIQCPVRNANGQPCGAWLRNLTRHIRVVHGVSIVEFDRLHPNVPLSVAEMKAGFTRTLQKRRKAQVDGGHGQPGDSPRKRGRPPKDNTAIKARASELKEQNSWASVTRICNREFGANFGKSYYRWLLKTDSSLSCHS